jgi:ABC-type uncharacterized transport system ATPase subunit
MNIALGELRGIIGPNGAGKTTMMDVITGKTRADEGSAFFGQTINLLRMSEPEIAHAGIGHGLRLPLLPLSAAHASRTALVAADILDLEHAIRDTVAV